MTDSFKAGNDLIISVTTAGVVLLKHKISRRITVHKASDGFDTMVMEKLASQDQRDCIFAA